ncbi:Ankyrin repeat protein 1 [Giardia muris]|uniref:Ankyrin repeat protein 1 n=1 Tax=Giardia muris TaxID=5742 RepID=A0A4Z1TAN0_GIAMU|nr:Ankyrin repeat protein 1 [Giardia muris]|eukprot:TNJ30277.1 Ankyrin repeat protein 1 [Giardia muris]
MDPELWFKAISSGNAEFVEEYLSRYAKSRRDDGDTGLIMAARANDVSIVELLAPVESGLMSRNGRTALITAATYDFPEVCAILAPREHMILSSDGRSPLMIAIDDASAKAIRILVPYAGRERDADGKTALDHAISMNNEEAVQLIVDTLKYPLGALASAYSAAKSKDRTSIAEIILSATGKTEEALLALLEQDPDTVQIDLAEDPASTEHREEYAVAPPPPVPIPPTAEAPLTHSQLVALLLEDPELCQAYTPNPDIKPWLSMTIQNLETFDKDYTKLTVDYNNLVLRHNALLLILRELKVALGYGSELDKGIVDYAYRLQTGFSEAQDQIRALQRLVRTLEVEVQDMNTEKKQMADTNTSSQEVEAMLRKTIEAKDAEYKLLQERYRDCQTKTIRQDDRIKKLTDDLAQAQNLVAEVSEERSSLRKIIDEVEGENRRLQERLTSDGRELTALRQAARRGDSAAATPVIGTGATEGRILSPKTPKRLADVIPSDNPDGQKTELEKIESKMAELREYENRLRQDKYNMQREAVEIRKEIDHAQDSAKKAVYEVKQLRDKMGALERENKTLRDAAQRASGANAQELNIPSSATTDELRQELATSYSVIASLREQITGLQTEKAISDRYLQELSGRNATRSRPGSAGGLSRKMSEYDRGSIDVRGSGHEPQRGSFFSTSLHGQTSSLMAQTPEMTEYARTKNLKLAMLRSHMEANTKLGEKEVAEQARRQSLTASHREALYNGTTSLRMSIPNDER